jgi:tRNA-specific 2-thiouridylase
VAEKKDSQGICFLGQVKMGDFLAHYLPDKPGEIVDTEGRVMGTHRGLHFYTIGQRKGHGVASPKEGMAYVVVGKRAAENRLVIGWDREDTEGLYSKGCVVGSVSSINERIATLRRVEAQPRYRAKAEPVELEAMEGGRVRLIFEKGQRALVPGQIMAFYDGGRLLGGGVVEQAT